MNVGLALNKGIVCGSCGEVHTWLTTTRRLDNGDILCGVPLLWTEHAPGPNGYEYVAPPHGIHAMIVTRQEMRLAFVWAK